MSLDDALREITNDLRVVPGLTFVPDDPPEQIHQFPVCLVYARTGTMRLGSADGGNGRPMWWHFPTIVIDVWVEHSDLTFDLPKVRPFATSVPAVLIAGFHRDRFGGSVVAFGDPTGRGATSAGGVPALRFELLMPDPSGVNAVGYRFELDVAIEDEVFV